MKIGSLEIKGHVVLGPMAGITNLAYREFMKPFGVGLSYTEMVSDCGLIYGNAKTFEYLKTSPADRPVGIQLFGFSAEHAEKAIAICEEKADYDVLDINLGCPVYKVTKTGAGSAWLKHPDALFAYMSVVVSASHKPVTAKIRLGWDEESINVEEVVSLLEKAGVSAIAIHARTAKQGYTGKADYQRIKGLGKKMSVPLVVSGDIYTPEAAKEAVDATGCQAVMVARGGVGRPFLVSQINQYLDTGSYEPDPGVLQQADYAEDYAKRLIALHGEETAVREMRGILPKFFSGFPGYKKIRAEIAANLSSEEQLQGLLNGIRRRGSL